MAMNGWGEGEPAWWLNLQALPRARVQLTDGTHEVVADAATGQERARLWERRRLLDKNLDGCAAGDRHQRPWWSSNPQGSSSPERPER